MVAIGWSNTTPAGDSTASFQDDAWRSMWTSICSGLAETMYWPGAPGASSASDGEMRLGTLRVVQQYDTAAGNPRVVMQGGGASGTMAFTRLNAADVVETNMGRGYLWQAGSATTQMMGHVLIAEHQQQPSNATYTARWVLSSGTVASSSVTTTDYFTVNFPVTYSVPPTVLLTPQRARGIKAMVSGVRYCGVAHFVSAFSAVTYPTFDAEPEPCIFHWISLGTVNV
jgi:hypothetical protein